VALMGLCINLALYISTKNQNLVLFGGDPPISPRMEPFPRVTLPRYLYSCLMSISFLFFIAAGIGNSLFHWTYFVADYLEVGVVFGFLCHRVDIHSTQGKGQLDNVFNGRGDAMTKTLAFRAITQPG